MTETTPSSSATPAASPLHFLQPTATISPSCRHYSYNRISRIGLSIDDLYDPLLHNDDDDDDDYYYYGEEKSTTLFSPNKTLTNKNTTIGTTVGTTIATAKNSMKSNQHNQRIKDAQIKNSVTSLSSSSSALSSSLERYPQIKQQRQVTKNQKKNEKQRQRDNVSAPPPPRYHNLNEKFPFHKEYVAILWNEIWLVHLDWVYCCRIWGRKRDRGYNWWYGGKYFSPIPSGRREVTKSQLCSELVVQFATTRNKKNNNNGRTTPSIPAAGASKNCIVLKQSKEFGLVSLECIPTLLPSSTTTSTNITPKTNSVGGSSSNKDQDDCHAQNQKEEAIQNGDKEETNHEDEKNSDNTMKYDFYVDSCLRTPELDCKILGCSSSEGGRANILDILEWHGIQLRLGEDDDWHGNDDRYDCQQQKQQQCVQPKHSIPQPRRREAPISLNGEDCTDDDSTFSSAGDSAELYNPNNSTSNSNNKRSNNSNYKGAVVKMMDKKSLSRLRLLRHGAYQFDRTVWIDCDEYRFRSGHSWLTVPAQRRLVALDRHRCYFFQLCSPKPIRTKRI